MIVSTTTTSYEVYVETDKTYRVITSVSCWSWSNYDKKTGTWKTRVTDEDVSYINSMLGTSFKAPQSLPTT
ncbi:MAG: hypothetical protein QXT53_06275 [Ignisphaera sp.]